MANAFDWPEDLGHGEIIARFADMFADRHSDSDRQPDLQAATETRVTITPSITRNRYTGEKGNIILWAHPVEGVIGSDGRLYTRDADGGPGDEGIIVPANDSEALETTGFTYHVRLRHQSDTVNYNIEVKTGETVDLAQVTPVDRSGGTAVIVDGTTAERAEQARDAAEGYRDETRTYRNQAGQSATAAATSATSAGTSASTAADILAATQALGITVDTSVGTRVYVGDTMIHGDTGWRLVHTLGEDIATSGQVLIRRVNDVVEVMIADIRWNNTSPGTNIIPGGVTLGVGFAQRSLSSRPQIAISDSDISYFDSLIPYVAAAARNLYIRYVSRMTGTSFQTGPFTSTNPLTGSIVWTTAERWPTSLPGTPA